MKSKRQEEILALIQEQNIETQNQLIEALRKRGVKSTQATLSRDIRELRLVKELSPDGGYRYTVPAREDSGDQLDRLRKIFRECVVSFDTAQNIVVIHTLPRPRQRRGVHARQSGCSESRRDARRGRYRVPCHARC